VADSRHIRQKPIGHATRELAEKRRRLRLAFCSVTQAFDPVMGRFDLGELTGNELLS
jgi:hypothetical protein